MPGFFGEAEKAGCKSKNAYPDRRERHACLLSAWKRPRNRAGRLSPLSPLFARAKIQWGQQKAKQYQRCRHCPQLSPPKYGNPGKRMKKKKIRWCGCSGFGRCRPGGVHGYGRRRRRDMGVTAAALIAEAEAIGCRLEARASGRGNRPCGLPAPAYCLTIYAPGCGRIATKCWRCWTGRTMTTPCRSFRRCRSRARRSAHGSTPSRSERS